MSHLSSGAQETSSQGDGEAASAVRRSLEPRQAEQLSEFEKDLQDTSDSESLPGAQQHAEFYDSEADESDQAWMQKQRQGRRSDAILSCPGCVTTVCVDCQRHEYVTTQYLAMFVTNCRQVVDTSV